MTRPGRRSNRSPEASGTDRWVWGLTLRQDLWSVRHMQGLSMLEQGAAGTVQHLTWPSFLSVFSSAILASWCR